MYDEILPLCHNYLDKACFWKTVKNKAEELMEGEPSLEYLFYDYHEVFDELIDRYTPDLIHTNTTNWNSLGYKTKNPPIPSLVVPIARTEKLVNMKNVGNDEGSEPLYQKVDNKNSLILKMCDGEVHLVGQADDAVPEGYTKPSVSAIREAEEIGIHILK